MSSLTHRARNIPHEMLLDIAAGMEEPVDIAFRYGFSASEYRQLEKNQQFLADIATIRAKREQSGEAAIAKAGMMYDILAEKYFLRLMDNEISTSQLAQGVEAFAVLGNRKPKAKDAAVQGAQFSITFNIPQGVQTPTTFDMQLPEVSTRDKALASIPTFDVTDAEETADGKSEV